ncbi:unnamed protein product [Dovyalis caffra]|uniref:Uncharacterized protein n=1 Tax=Dovyalis caffra TaxID=77055 RepID=A0AAV1S7Z2_9ROSI|nr:unnamed protein product [Dovyalis caffra]
MSDPDAKSTNKLRASEKTMSHAAIGKVDGSQKLSLPLFSTSCSHIIKYVRPNEREVGKAIRQPTAPKIKLRKEKAIRECFNV